MDNLISSNQHNAAFLIILRKYD